MRKIELHQQQLRIMIVALEIAETRINHSQKMV